MRFQGNKILILGFLFANVVYVHVDAVMEHLGMTDFHGKMGLLLSSAMAKAKVRNEDRNAESRGMNEVVLLKTKLPG